MNCPEKSPDGKKVAYVRYLKSQYKEPYGIEIFDLDTGVPEWAYEPANRDGHYWPQQNIYIGEVTGERHRLLSWSPDGRYIAFVVGGLLGESDQQILRLDLNTGEIVRLTTRLITPKAITATGGYRHYLAPAWGP